MDLRKAAESLKGTVGIYFKNLLTGETLGFNESREFHPASIIKLPLVMAIYKMEAEGTADLNEKLKVTYACRVPSCGAFNAFTDEPLVDIRTLCNLTITISDNTGANMLIDHFGIERLNAEFREMGLKKTHIERLFYDDAMQEKGYNNKAVPEEIGFLLEQIYQGAFVNEKVSDEIWKILEQQQDRAGIPAYIEDEAPVGNKTGGARGITADAALIRGDHPFVLVVVFNETYVPEADEWMRHLARDIFEELKHGDRI
ncbi:MAG: class A beta-lactamase-related serine hydrolase [Firmicutes bacterium]|nr:class A beta-lactamase-related serine hydrolase [Bacillota bacterium]MDD7601766.1 class A beta-lactamase-related serine hydrolase [Bacillota bacterium]MDY5855476.1 serine hydrolase [Anaerovoracaceae bacterium]